MYPVRRVGTSRPKRTLGGRPSQNTVIDGPQSIGWEEGFRQDINLLSRMYNMREHALRDFVHFLRSHGYTDSEIKRMPERQVLWFRERWIRKKEGKE